MTRRTGTRSARLALATAAAVLLGAASAPAFTLGFNEPLLSYSAPADQGLLTQRMRAAPAERVRIVVDWREVTGSSAAPSDAEAADPGWPGYDWHHVDGAVAAATASGLSVLFVVEVAPRWAEGKRRPKRAAAGSWRPSATKLAAFMTALARRFPTVRAFQVWNEPNFPSHLSPQFTRGGGRATPVAAQLYRRLLARSYVALKRVSSRNVVVAAGVAPFGDYPLGRKDRTPPMYFTRQLLCRSGPRAGCGSPARFDVFAGHVYPRSPQRRARHSDDLAITELGRLRALLAGAGRGARLWVTEFGWPTRRPDFARVVSQRTQARYFVESLYLMWRQHVDAAFWWRVRDSESRSKQFMGASGFYADGSSIARDDPKVIVAAARLPFVATHAGRRVGGWALPLQTAPLTIERRGGDGWQAIATWQATARRPISRRLPAREGELLRARQGEAVSLPWRVP